MPAIDGLRSPYAKTGPLVYVGRMFDKIRLHARGALPADFHGSLGAGLDRRACGFLGVEYADLKITVLNGLDDDAVLAWCFAKGRARDEYDCAVWNAFMSKLGWRDHRSEFLRERVAEAGFAGRGIETFFDLIEIDEDRPLHP
jgi:hypothetical protein